VTDRSGYAAARAVEARAGTEAPGGAGDGGCHAGAAVMEAVAEGDHGVRPEALDETP